MKARIFMTLFAVIFMILAGCSSESCPSCPDCPEDTFVMSFQNGVLPSPAYEAVYSAHINQSNPGNLYTDCTYMNLGVSGGVNRIALFFDVTEIPADAVVVKAYLTLTTQLLAGGYSFTAYRQYEYWWDGNAGCGISGSGFDPTWNGPWDTAGGVLTSSVGTATSSTSRRALTFELSTSMVQDWVTNGVSNGADGNHGVIIKKDSESSGYLTIHNKNSVSESYRPVLTVYYRLP